MDCNGTENNAVIIKGQQGSHILLHENYTFKIIKRSKYDDDEIFRLIPWCCTVDSCLAKVYTSNLNPERVIDWVNNHNGHQKPDTKSYIFSDRCKKNFLRKTFVNKQSKENSESTSAGDNNILGDIDTLLNCGKSLYNNTEFNISHPVLPRSIDEVHVAIDSLDSKFKMYESKPFVLINDPYTHIIIFSSYINLKALCRTKFIFIDGTLQYYPTPFAQLFSIYGLYNGRYTPLLFALLPDKRTQTYINLFENIRTLCYKQNLIFHPKLFVLDFDENAIRKALNIVWTNINIFGSRFHLMRTWFKKIEELGLIGVYKKYLTSDGKWLRRIFGLPFISPNEVGDCFVEDFMSIISEDKRIVMFADYLVDTYISEEAEFPPSMWATNVASLALVTSVCESYYGYFDSKFYYQQPNIFKLLDVLKEFQTRHVVGYKVVLSRHIRNQFESFTKINENYYKKKFDRMKLISMLLKIAPIQTIYSNTY